MTCTHPVWNTRGSYETHPCGDEARTTIDGRALCAAHAVKVTRWTARREVSATGHRWADM